jgi:hypothetical protein
MRLKEIIRLTKKALKTPHLYTPDEVAYMEKALDDAILKLARKKFLKKKKKGFGWYERGEKDETS